jgi:hypothetical protein
LNYLFQILAACRIKTSEVSDSTFDNRVALIIRVFSNETTLKNFRSLAKPTSPTDC